jgi:hypothetical protein
MHNFARAELPDARRAVQEEACWCWHFLLNVTMPILPNGSPEWNAFYELAHSYRKLAGSQAIDAWNYPDDGGRQLLIDRIDQIHTVILEARKDLERVADRTAKMAKAVLQAEMVKGGGN